jgi:hypothetical protein
VRRPRDVVLACREDQYAVSLVLRHAAQRLSRNLSRPWLWVPDQRSPSLACPKRRAVGSSSNSQADTLPRSRGLYARVMHESLAPNK